MHKLIIILAVILFPLNSFTEEVNYLLTASAKNDIETVKAIIESGADVNVVDSNNL
ncbi:MAG: ankyrin repeat domain-containing protein, partial [Methylophilaceae bacterium]|nr:ankyrin repeat domain-containing protein [Methylophilaceae bacterium]